MVTMASPVVPAAEEGVLLQALQLLAEWCDRLGDLVLHLGVEREQVSGVLVLAGQAPVAIEALGQARVLGRDRGGPLLVVPEAGCAHLLLERGGAFFQRIGVKGNHGPSRAGP